MIPEPTFNLSEHMRTGVNQWWSELVATFGLILVIYRCKTYSIPIIALAVAAYITAAYWFTASTSFANPAVTLARSLTSTFSGIYWKNVPEFILAQLIGGGAGLLVNKYFNMED